MLVIYPITIYKCKNISIGKEINSFYNVHNKT